MVMGDNIIPNVCTEAVARALELLLVGEVLQPIAGVAVSADALLHGDERVPATHVNVWRSTTEDELVQVWYGGLLDGRGVLAPLP